MKKILIILSLLALTALMVFKLFANQKETQDKIYHYDETQAILVSADFAKVRSLSHNKVYTGTFEPVREIKLMPEAQGKIIQFNGILGQYFKKGQTVAALDNELLKLQLETIEVQMEGFQKDIKRYKILTAADAIQGVHLEKTELALKAAQVQRKIIEEQISRTTVYAPFSGVVTQQFADLGAMAAPAAPLVQFTDMSSLYLTLRVPESDLYLFKKNQTLEVKVNSISEKSFIGKIAIIGSKGDVAHNFPIQIKVSNVSGNPIKSGMFGEIALTSNTDESLLSIPSKAIVGSILQPQAFIVEEGKAVLTNLKTGGRVDDYTLVLSGLENGDRVVTSGFVNLKDGVNVKAN